MFIINLLISCKVILVISLPLAIFSFNHVWLVVKLKGSKENAPSCLSEIGIQTSSGHYLVKGQDHLGLWVQHPGIFIKKTIDKNGNPIPLDIQTEDKRIQNIV